MKKLLENEKSYQRASKDTKFAAFGDRKTTLPTSFDILRWFWVAHQSYLRFPQYLPELIVNQGA